MSIEERRALLGEVESPRRGAPVVAIAFALVAAGGIAASAWLWTRLEGERDARIASEARLAAETLARANAVAESTRRLGAVEGELAKRPVLRQVAGEDAGRLATDARVGVPGGLADRAGRAAPGECAEERDPAADGAQDEAHGPERHAQLPHLPASAFGDDHEGEARLCRVRRPPPLPQRARGPFVSRVRRHARSPR